MKVIIAKLGDKALASIVRIWQHIYKHNGYYMDYNEDELYMIKRWLGHTAIKTTCTYLHLSPDYLAQTTSPLDLLYSTGGQA